MNDSLIDFEYLDKIYEHDVCYTQWGLCESYSNTQVVIKLILVTNFPALSFFQEWPAEFTLSDHRLLTAEFDLLEKQLNTT